MSADVYWIADVPFGRLAILGRPRAGEWLHDEITDWAASGLTDVVSLPEDHEVRELELTREAELVRHAGLDFERFPIPDRGVPPLESTHELWRRLEAKLRDERSIGIDCRASIGRAGLVAIGTLLRLGGVQKTSPGNAPRGRVADRHLIPTNNACGFLRRIAGRRPPSSRRSRQSDNLVAGDGLYVGSL
jgi:hypothetical protein